MIAIAAADVGWSPGVMVQWGDAAAATACRRTGRHGHEEGLSVSPQKMAAEEAKLFFCSLTFTHFDETFPVLSNWCRLFYTINAILVSPVVVHS